MNEYAEQLRAVPLFADLADDDLDRLAKGVEPISLDPGDILFSEGDSGERAYVITAGEVDILKITGERQVLLARRRVGEVVGEIALLDSAPRSATVKACAPTELLSIPKRHLDETMASSATAARALFEVVLSKWRQTEAHLRQSERMAQLGTLTAGLAHELNNPAAAVRRGADQLRTSLVSYSHAHGKAESVVSAGSKTDLEAILERASQPPQFIDGLERSDRESAVEAALGPLGIDDAWEMAIELVAAGFSPEDVGKVADDFGAEAAPAVLKACATAQQAFSLLAQVEEGASRLSAIVGSLKSYSYLDQAPIQEVDVTIGLEDTLLILKSKLGEIEVRRQYAPDLPIISAYASELNQVFTNLIDNAIDAITESGRPDGVITLRTSRAEDTITVEVEDNGAGIPSEIRSRIFDAFFTTKPPGSGTGLGLDISYGIVVNRHRGEFTVESDPGRTVFAVELSIVLQE